MIREVDLVSYLPPFLAEYKEIRAALAAEDPEFRIIWEAADRVLWNEFIATADEFGVSRYEKLLGITPYEKEQLESRRNRVMARWFTRIPYTIRALIEKMALLCPKNDFEIRFPVLGAYKLDAIVSIDPDTEPLLSDICDLLEEFIPANLIYQATGRIERKKTLKIRVGNARGICVRIKAEPDKRNSRVSRTIDIKAGIGTLYYTKTTYWPEEE